MTAAPKTTHAADASDDNREKRPAVRESSRLADDRRASNESQVPSADEALRQQRERFHAVFNQAAIGMAIADLDGRFVQTNRRFEEISGYSAEELHRRRFDNLTFPEDLPETRRLVAQLIAGDIPDFSVEKRYVQKNGASIWCHVSVTLLRDSSGRPEGFVGAVEDISRRKDTERTLRETAQRLQLALSAGRLADWTWHATNDVVEFGLRGGEIFDLPPDRVVTWDQLRERIHADDRERARRAVERALADRTDYDIEYRVALESGEIRWVAAKGRGVYGDDGTVLRMTGVVQDISARKNAEQALRAREQQLSLIYSNVADVISYVAVEPGEFFRYLSVNPAFLDATGLGESEVTGHLVTHVLPEPGRNVVIANYRKAIHEKRTIHWEETSTTADGERVGAASVTPLFDPTGHCTHLIGTVHDLTDRKRAEEALRTSAALYRRLADEQKQAAEALREQYAVTEHLNSVSRSLATELQLTKIVQIVTDAATQITRAQFGVFWSSRDAVEGRNAPLRAFCGSVPAAIQNASTTRIAEFVGASLAGAPVRRVDDLRSPGALAESAAVGSLLGACEALVSYLAVPVISRSGAVLGTLFFGHSAAAAFTERDEKIVLGISAQTAAALDTAQLYRNEQQARSAAEQASQAKDHFLAALSHELRTPLTPVLAILSSLHDDAELPASVAGEIETMRRNVELEARLIDDLLDITRITRGKLELHCEAVDLNQLIENNLRTFEPEALAKRLTLVTQLSGAKLSLRGDSARITQVVWNVLKNAIKFTPAGGTITVRSGHSTEDGAARVWFEVKDTGIGIEPTQTSAIFDAFEQGGRRITQQFGGLGLGLAISRAITELHQGSITAESAGPEQGSTFRITLPVDCAAEKEGKAPLAETTTLRSPAVPRIPGGNIAKVRILFVEDHADTATALMRILQRTGYDVFHAGSIAEALATAAQENERSKIALVISDLGLPDGSGIDLMRELHATYGLRGIALSGFGMESDRERTRAAGFLRHLIKPVNIALLRTTVAEVLAELEGTTPPATPG